jgi:hypothetical protein
MHDHGGRAGPPRPPRPSRRWWRPQLAGLVGAALALTLTVAACGGGGNTNGVASLGGANKPTATTTAKPWSKQDAMQAALAFARCMRQHGIDMPDPKFNGNGISQEFTARRGSNGPASPTFKAAQQACNKYLPNGGQPPKLNPQQRQQLVAFARCMREHGIDVPDPGPNSGGIVVKRSGANGRNAPEPEDDPKFKAAQQACQQYLPNVGKGPALNSGGGK